MSRTVISVFGSSRCQPQSQLYQLAYELGRALGTAGFAVASGGYSGAMEAVSRGAAECGGHVIGVVSSAVSGKTNPWVAEEIVAASWQERLHKLISLGDGYVACRGGTGTLVELAVAWEMMCKSVMPRRPLVGLGEFWRPVVELITACDEGARSEGLVWFADSVPAAIEALQAAVR